ncbi:MAG: aminotransferase class V-fold PLP-dependent enzyme [Chloroflexota bacterium]|nr:aminotransferase class V-fold PLP-dependent enzyme [Chloroflexota bacterium]MDE2941204.1 aminotransferase class V-fold PLP-dependent enzyme [Chloroflexota bacterium]MDE3268182.1 aminotransferase class V-fold PLP-dependent enzyme [Chloroflexota bacterium]
MNTDQLRELLPITRDRIYMNTGWAGPTPTTSLRRMAETLEQEALVGPASARGVALDREANRAAAAAAAGLLGAAEDDVILTHSTREGVNVVIYGMDWKPGDELLICDLEHPALTTPAKVVAERMGVSVKSAPIATMSTFDESLNLVKSEMTDRTKLVALSHIQFTCGLRLPIGEITEAAHAAGVPVLVDGAQSVGQIAVNVTDLGCDFYTMSGQKWPMGPVGTGALYVNPDRRDMLEPLFSTNALEAERVGFRRGALGRFSLVSNSPGLAACLTESLRIISEIGIDRIEAHAMNLGNMLRHRASMIKGCELLSTTDQESACGLVTLGLDGWPPEDLVSTLQDRFNIVGRTVHGPDGVRFSTHYFNTASEVDKVAEVLERLAAEGYRAQG